jgi:hypothetical protein
MREPHGVIKEEGVRGREKKRERRERGAKGRIRGTYTRLA